MDSVDLDTIFRDSIAKERVIVLRDVECPPVTLYLESKHKIWYLPKKNAVPHNYSSTAATDSQHHKHRVNISNEQGKKREKYRQEAWKTQQSSVYTKA